MNISERIMYLQYKYEQPEFKQTYLDEYGLEVPSHL